VAGGGVAICHAVGVVGGGQGLAQVFGGGGVSVVSGQGGVEDAAGGGQAIVDFRVQVRLFGVHIQGGIGDGVGVVFVPAAGEGDVESAPVGGLVDDGAGHIDGDALGAVDGGRVAQFGGAGDVVRVEGDPAPVFEVAHGQRAVAADLL